ncbi:MAG TPA: membrane dipeptidase [Methylomirabilota bacterium]|nr:membrane dipeptidase [Methylomirabilota bacterium]
MSALRDDAFSVDLHSHPALIPALASTTVDGHAKAIASGKVGAIVLAAVGDLPVLGLRETGGIYAAREPEPGELLASTWQQLDFLAGSEPALGLRPVLRAGDLAEAAAAKSRSGILAVEGCDFLEGRLERVQAAYDRSVRSLQLVHYRINELGDIQTEPPRHGGLTPFGREVVREMNRLRMLIDLAHAPFDVVKGAVDASDQPLTISHSAIQDATGFPRFVSFEHARLVTSHGGLIGAWPFSLTDPSFETFIEHIARLVDAVGVEHVAIGTDMDGTGPFGLFRNYAEWPTIPAALLARGFAPDDVAKIMGGNARRLLEAVLG